MKKSIRVQFQNESLNYNTSININTLEHVDYFVGQSLNLGAGIEDNMQKCIGVATIASSNDLNAEKLTYVHIYNPHSNRTLPAVYSEKHGGILGFTNENKPYYNDAVLDQVGNPFVDDVDLLIYPTWKCHGKTHRLVVETVKETPNNIRIYRSDK
jgi:hypothetical protein